MQGRGNSPLFPGGNVKIREFKGRVKKNTIGYDTQKRREEIDKNLTFYKPKGFIFPEGFQLLVDTREQRQLFERMPKGLTIKSTTLENGDYSIAGFTNLFAVERKGLSDFYKYIASDRDMTVMKMKRFSEMIRNGGWVGLIIEHQEQEVWRPQLFSSVSPEVARAALRRKSRAIYRIMKITR